MTKTNHTDLALASSAASLAPSCISGRGAAFDHLSDGISLVEVLREWLSERADDGTIGALPMLDAITAHLCTAFSELEKAV